jgi:hypothetical protein
MSFRAKISELVFVLKGTPTVPDENIVAPLRGPFK